MRNKVKLIYNSPDTELLIENNMFYEKDARIRIISAFSDEAQDLPPSTLKDISIVMQSMVGSGCTKQLAIELSNRLNGYNASEIENILWSIFDKYYKKSDKEAIKNFLELPDFNVDAE